MAVKDASQRWLVFMQHGCFDGRSVHIVYITYNFSFTHQIFFEDL